MTVEHFGPGPAARIELVAANCTSCMLCVRACPTWCIELDSHQEVDPDSPGRRPKVRNMLDRFAIDWGLCMFCGICVQVCPFEALEWAPDAVPAGTRAELDATLWQAPAGGNRPQRPD